MRNIIGGLAEKTEDHIERAHQDGMRIARSYIDVTNFRQSQTSQV